MVEQDHRQVESFQRADGWQRQIHAEGEVDIPCLGARLALQDVYCDWV